MKREDILAAAIRTVAAGCDSGKNAGELAVIILSGFEVISEDKVVPLTMHLALAGALVSFVVETMAEQQAEENANAN
jgi:hypothetical protein